MIDKQVKPTFAAMLGRFLAYGLALAASWMIGMGLIGAAVLAYRVAVRLVGWVLP